MPTMPTIPKTFVRPLKIHSLSGRVVELPAPDSRHTTDILVIYGHHSSLERMYSTAEAINQFGSIIMPDLPGFGGMPSLADIGKRPSIDNLADYLADFVRQRFANNKQFVIFGMSFGFVVATRMLQRHPDLQKQVRFVISFVGFTHFKDFKVKARTYNLLKFTASTLSKRRLPARIIANTIVQRPFIATAYNLRAKTHPKMKGFSYDERKSLIDFEVVLWQSNELYTYFATGHEMLTLDLTHTPVAVPVHHIAVEADQYFDNKVVKRHMEQIYAEYHLHEAEMENHAPTIIETAAAAKKIIPKTIGDLFS